MNYYNRYPSHYLAATLHLSMEQDGAYCRLMDWCYANERPIPDSKRTAIGRATTRKERAAIDYILSAFFDRSEDGSEWSQRRIESEINKSAPKIQAAKKNGKLGGRPRKEEPTGFSEQNPLGLQNKTQTEPSAKAPQTPSPIDQELSNPTGLEVIVTDNLPAEADPVNGIAKGDRTPIQKIVALYHDQLPSCRRCEKLTPARAGYIRQRWREDLTSMDAWVNFFGYVAQSPFLTGKTQGRDGKPPFMADIEFLTKPASFAKIAEGKYHQ